MIIRKLMSNEQVALSLDNYKMFLTSPVSSQKEIKEVLSISICWPALSNSWTIKWKKFDFRKLEGGCFVNSARPMEHLKQKILE